MKRGDFIRMHTQLEPLSDRDSDIDFFQTHYSNDNWEHRFIAWRIYRIHNRAIQRTVAIRSLLGCGGKSIHEPAV